MKKSIKLTSAILAVASILTFATACDFGGKAEGTGTSEQTALDTADRTANESADTTVVKEVTTEPVETTLDLSPATKEMKDALEKLLTDMPKNYSERVSLGYQIGFDALKNEIMGKIDTLNVAEYNDCYDQVKTMLGNIGYEKGSTPRVYIDTFTSGVSRTYSYTSIVVVDADGGKRAATVANKAEIRIRGNSSAESSVDKKSYKIKFENSENVLGIGKSKTYALISNALDKTLLRNKLAYDFAKALGNVNVPDCTYVDVYLNGKLMGNYLLCETVSEGEDKVDLKLSEGDFLLELEQNNRGDAALDPENVFIRTPYYNCNFCVKEPEKADMLPDQKQAISSFLKSAEEALQSRDREKIEEYFDVDSFIDFYIVSELFKNLDVAYSSTYFYVKNDKIYAGPVWDFDLSSGNVSSRNGNVKYQTYLNNNYGRKTGKSYEGIWVAHFPDYNKNTQDYFTLSHQIEEDEVRWYSAIFACTDIMNQMIDRYNEVQPLIINLFDDNELGRNQIDKNMLEQENSFYDNYHNTDTSKTAWQPNKNSTAYEMNSRDLKPTHEENVEVLRNWLYNRNEWLLQKFASMKK